MSVKAERQISATYWRSSKSVTVKLDKERKHSIGNMTNFVHTLIYHNLGIDILGFFANKC
jgi:hypothetical protein